MTWSSTNCKGPILLYGLRSNFVMVLEGNILQNRDIISSQDFFFRHGDCGGAGGVFSSPGNTKMVVERRKAT